MAAIRASAGVAIVRNQMAIGTRSRRSRELLFSRYTLSFLGYIVPECMDVRSLSHTGALMSSKFSLSPFSARVPCKASLYNDTAADTCATVWLSRAIISFLSCSW